LRCESTFGGAVEDEDDLAGVRLEWVRSSFLCHTRVVSVEILSFGHLQALLRVHAQTESDHGAVWIELTVKWLECVELAVWLAAESGGHC